MSDCNEHLNRHRLSPSRSQLSETSEFMLTSTTSMSWSSNKPY